MTTIDMGQLKKSLGTGQSEKGEEKATVYLVLITTAPKVQNYREDDS